MPDSKENLFGQTESNPINPSKSSSVACYSLFSGPGGLDLGFEKAGATILYAADVDPVCVETYNANHVNSTGQTVARVRDLSTTTVESILAEALPNKGYEVLGVIGGPPCQSFSYANVYATEIDPRHRLPEHYARIVKGLREKVGLDFFLFENVPGLLSSQHLEKFERFKRMFEEAGFRIFQGGLDAVDFGVAQVRPRVFIVGLNKEKYPFLRYNFPIPPLFQHKRTVREVIGGLPEPVYNAKGLNPANFPVHPNHWCLVPRSSKFSKGFAKKMGGKSFKVLDWDRPSYTVAYGHREVHVHPDGHRRLSIYEALLLQGFPTNYVLKGNISAQIREVSEAVCPVVANVLAQSIIETFSRAQGGGSEDGTQRNDGLKKAIP